MFFRSLHKHGAVYDTAHSTDNFKQPCTSVPIVLTTNVINPLATFPLILSGLEKEKPFLSDFSQYHFACNYILTCNTSCYTSFK